VKDVIVIGGGPAGNQTALSLSRRGFQVTVLDYRQRLGDKLCTGIVGVECVRSYGVPGHLIYKRVRGAAVVSPAGRSFLIEHDQEQACVIDRVAFVSHIADKAQQAGAEYRIHRTVTGIKVGDDGVQVCATGPDGERESHDARAVVIASGFKSNLPRLAGLAPASVPAFAGQVPVELAEDLDTVRVYAGRHVPKGAFGWLVPAGPRTALAGLIGRGRPNEALVDFLAALEEEGLKFHQRGPVRTWGVPLRPAPRTFGERVVLVGDVAGQVKPATGGGIYYSLLCADVAAETLGRALKTGDLSEDSLRQYEDNWRGRLGSELRMGYLARQIYEALGPHELDTLVMLAASNGILKHGFAFDWHGDLVARALRYELFDRVLAPFRSRH
jgi:geranylgeranyl reductase family protein